MFQIGLGNLFKEEYINYEAYITDDDFVIASSIRDCIERLRFATTTVTEGESIKYFLKHNPCDLILMNINLTDGSNGIEIMAEIRAFSSIPVIYLTGDTDVFTRERADKTNPAGFILKPFSFDELGYAIVDIQ